MFFSICEFNTKISSLNSFKQECLPKLIKKLLVNTSANNSNFSTSRNVMPSKRLKKNETDFQLQSPPEIPDVHLHFLEMACNFY